MDQQSFNIYTNWILFFFAQSILAWELGQKGFIILIDGPTFKKSHIVIFVYMLYFLMFVLMKEYKLLFPLDSIKNCWPLYINLFVYIVAVIQRPNIVELIFINLEKGKIIYYDYIQNLNKTTEAITNADRISARKSKKLNKAKRHFYDTLELIKKQNPSVYNKRSDLIYSPRHVGVYTDIAITNYQLGMLLSLQGYFPEAIEALSSAAWIIERWARDDTANKIYVAGACYYHLGIIAELQNSFDIAKRHFIQSSTFYSSINHVRGIEQNEKAIMKIDNNMT